MTCIVCHEGEVCPDTTSYGFERDGRMLVVTEVPADVCRHCGEAFLSDLVAGRLLAIAATVRRCEESVLIRSYASAA
jgi:YgiT-type zinc finger domain-containing protein